MSYRGKNIALCVGIWLIIKGVLNLILGFSLGNVFSLLLAFVILFVFKIGIKHANYIVAAILAIVVIRHLPYNIMHFQIIYLLEAAVDALAVYLLVANKDVKEYFAGI